MPKNLRQKLALVLDDSETLPRFELLQRLERVVLEEINFHDAEHFIDSVDISQIRSKAVTNYTQMRLTEDALGRITGDGEAIRHLCLIQSVVEFLRSKGLVNFKISYNKK